MSRTQRQMKILDLISKHDIDTQEELVTRLREDGFKATQATVSRDIKELKLIKVQVKDSKRHKYAAQEQTPSAISDKFGSMFRTFVLGIRTAGTLVVVRTDTGSAGPVAEFIDRLNYPEVLGVIAGDNTIFIAADTEYNAETVAEKLDEMLKQ